MGGCTVLAFILNSINVKYYIFYMLHKSYNLRNEFIVVY